MQGIDSRLQEHRLLEQHNPDGGQLQDVSAKHLEDPGVLLSILGTKQPSSD